MFTKKDIRKLYLEKRLNLPAETMAVLNGQLLAQCCAIDYSPYQMGHIFLPISGKREADTFAFVAWARQAYPGLQWAISRSDLKTAAMEHFLWEPDAVLVKNAYGIPEPMGGIPVLPAEIDLVFVPLLAFDQAGHRVGYGKGMYDRFLQQCRPDAMRIGLSLFEPVDAITDTDAWDVPLNKVITPEAIYQFKLS
jgi:5-formyltetrahydrofolate cyclo-ligase